MELDAKRLAELQVVADASTAANLDFRFVAKFDPPTVRMLLDEIDRLRATVTQLRREKGLQ